ncbi:MAG: 50S ribosomal protein L11 methyltransferase [Desulfobacterales bacterium]|jgi:ribosomal protein L11 methyltransferase
MNKLAHMGKDPEEASGNPYSDLYIYYLKGRIKPITPTFGSGFIGNWQENEYSFLFFSKPSSVEVAGILNSNPELTLFEEFHMTYDQWQGSKTEPFDVGRFHIVPPWQRNKKKKIRGHEAITVLLDPGVVFGNGLHTTTRDCIKALEIVFSRDQIKSAVDFGTGTGILALAASLLGCGRILAIDLNFLAVSTALRNIRLNGLGNRILAAQGRAEDFIDAASDLVIANIHYEVMKDLIGSRIFYNKKWFVLSGLLRSQARAVKTDLIRNGITIINSWECDGIWHTLLGKKD